MFGVFLVLRSFILIGSGGNVANSDHVKILKQGVEAWNSWRYRHKTIQPDLNGISLVGLFLKGINLQKADLRGADLSKAILSDANLREANFQQSNLQGIGFENANLSHANLVETNLSDGFLLGANFRNASLAGSNFHKALLKGANLSEASCIGADFSYADLSDTDLTKTNFTEANMERTFFTYADLSWAICKGANLSRATLAGAKLYWTDFTNAILTDATLATASFLETNLENADLSRSWIYGISVWNPNLKGTKQRDLVITSSHADKSEITVDNLEVAQFVYLLLRTAKIRDVIDTIGRKAVLILGRFAVPERKEILDGMRELLREKGYLPIVFDFEKSEERDFTETIQVLAGISLFVIADITNPKSSPLELEATVPDYMIPFVPIIQKGELPFAMFVDLQHKFRWVLDVREYNDKEHLMNNLENGVIKPALEKHNELLILKNEDLKIRSINEI